MTAPGWSAIIATPLPDGWRFGIRCDGAAVYETEFLPAATLLQAPDSECARRAVADVQRYFAAGHSMPATALAPHGTPFQQRVWQALRAIPPGQPYSYGELAHRLGSSPRAVAGACRANPIPLLIPCHRVVAAHGPGGFMGATEGEPLRLKNWLLEHEAAG